MREKTLTIRDLTVSFQTGAGTVRAVRGVDLDLYRGETLAIVGESGSGKSVTVKAVMGIASSNQTIESGSILYHGGEEERDLLKLSRREMRRQINGTHIAMVFQLQVPAAGRHKVLVPHRCRGSLFRHVSPPPLPAGCGDR